MRPGVRRAALPIACLAGAAWLAGCGATPVPKPTPRPTPRATPTPLPTPTPTPPPRQITVLAPDGVNMRLTPSLTARVLGIVAQGVQLAYLGQTPTAGGWYHVEGATHVGWVTADPAYTAPGVLESYSSGVLQFGALYPNGWTFSETPPSVTFAPASAAAGPGPGATTTPALIVTAARGLARLPLGAPRGAGFAQATSVEVFGVTTIEDSYTVPAGQLWLTVRFQPHAGLAFLVVARGPAAPVAAALHLLLLTFHFPPHARFG